MWPSRAKPPAGGADPARALRARGAGRLQVCAGRGHRGRPSLRGPRHRAIRERTRATGSWPRSRAPTRHPGVGGTAAAQPRRRASTWVVDPLDGTIDYANGIPFFCVSIGLVVDGCPRRASSTTRCAARRSGPPRRRGLPGRGPIQASRQGAAQRLRGLAGPRRAGRRDPGRGRSARRSGCSRNMGSAALALAYVANGRFDAFVQSARDVRLGRGRGRPDRRARRRDRDGRGGREMVRRRSRDADVRADRGPGRPARGALRLAREPG